MWCSGSAGRWPYIDFESCSIRRLAFDVGLDWALDLVHILWLTDRVPLRDLSVGIDLPILSLRPQHHSSFQTSVYLLRCLVDCSDSGAGTGIGADSGAGFPRSLPSIETLRRRSRHSPASGDLGNESGMFLSHASASCSFPCVCGYTSVCRLQAGSFKVTSTLSWPSNIETSLPSFECTKIPTPSSRVDIEVQDQIHYNILQRFGHFP